MSLTSFVKLPDVAQRLAPFRPVVRPIKRPMRVFPTSGCQPTLLGTAFDYLLRFELQRRAPHAGHTEWAAELAAEIVREESPDADILLAPEPLEASPRVIHLRPEDLAERISSLCQAAREALDTYLLDPKPDRQHQCEMAAWALRLAKLDGAYRARELDLTFEYAPEAAIDELVALLDVAPFDSLIHPTSMLLNPAFGAASLLVDGADADLITGDTLIDFKTTRSATVKASTLDQLFGYFLLARREGLPPIRRIGVYLSRYGLLRTGATAEWTAHPEFASTERWVFERAAQVFGRPAVDAGFCPTGSHLRLASLSELPR